MASMVIVMLCRKARMCHACLQVCFCQHCCCMTSLPNCKNNCEMPLLVLVVLLLLRVLLLPPLVLALVLVVVLLVLLLMVPAGAAASAHCWWVGCCWCW